MALDATNEIINSTHGYVVQGTAVKGGYFVTATIAAIPSHANVTGALCFCTADSKFYKYNGSSWVVASFITDTDKENIKEYILAKLPPWTGGSY